MGLEQDWKSCAFQVGVGAGLSREESDLAAEESVVYVCYYCVGCASSLT
jgi:hypothetical protein